jgi:CubicO group peptidase (beta-lactamase class C family)
VSNKLVCVTLWHPLEMRVIGVLTLTLVAWSQTPSPDAPSAIVKHIEVELAQAKVPGAAIAVVSGNHVVASGYGIARAGEPTAMTPLTLVQVGSLTKLFTALAVISALDANNLAMQTPIGDVKPWLSARAAATTFHQLLAQTSGLRDQTGGDGTNDELALASAAREIDNADFILPADVVFSYSNVGYALAGAGLEWVAKVGFADALRTQALRPLGMERSTVRPSEVASQPHAAGHRLDSAKPVAIASPANDVRLWPSGYLWTNATDNVEGNAGAHQQRRGFRISRPEAGSDRASHHGAHANAQHLCRWTLRIWTDVGARTRRAGV